MSAVPSRLGTLSGTMLAPGVSKNRRRYTPQNIKSAYERLSARLSDPSGRPVTMRTFHPGWSADNQDVRHIAATLTKVELGPAHELRWEADIAPTDAGRDVVALTQPDESGKPRHLANVSIRGRWMGDVYTDADGNDSSDDLEIEGLDFVSDPGVEAARIESSKLGEAAAAAGLITESVEDTAVSDAAPIKPYADQGYLADKVKRLPLGSAAEIRSAWVFMASEDAQRYSAPQSRRIRGRIKTAAKEAGVDITSEMTCFEEAAASLLEAYASVYFDNGPGTVSVSGWTNEPEKLAQVAKRVALAALAGLSALDPDQDGDIDLDDGDSDPDEPEVPCPACLVIIPAGCNFCPECGSAMPDDSQESAPDPGAPASAIPEGGTSVPTPAAPTAGAPKTTAESFRAALAEIVKPAPAAPPVESAPAAPAPAAPAPAAAPVAAAPVEGAPVAPAAPAATEGAPAPAAASAAPVPGAETATVDAKAVAVELAKMLGIEVPAESATSASQATDESTLLSSVKEFVGEGIKAATDALRSDLTAAGILPGRKGVAPQTPAGESGPSKPLHEMSPEERRAYAREAWSGVFGNVRPVSVES